MLQYRFWVAFELQIGLLFNYNKKENSLTIQIPLIEIIVCFNKDANGIYFFKH